MNKVILIGNIGQAPETKFTQGGMAITTISLATSEKRKDKEGNRTETTEWHRVKFFGKLAETAGEYLQKGSKLAIEGKVKYDKYEKDGRTVYTTEILADQMEMLDSRPSSGAAPQSAPPLRARQGYVESQGQTNKSSQPDQSDGFDDDEIPFN